MSLEVKLLILCVFGIMAVFSAYIEGWLNTGFAYTLVATTLVVKASEIEIILLSLCFYAITTVIGKLISGDLKIYV